MATITINLLFLIFFGATFVQTLTWLILFMKLALYKESLLDMDLTEIEEKPISIIICARNEAKNLLQNIPHFLSQNYRSFEIIVVNDDSNDETFQILFEFQEKSPIFRIVNAIGVKKNPGKKAALKLGIKAAIYDQILLTDADCVPSSKNWIKLMQSKLVLRPTIILGYSPYSYIPRSSLNAFIRYETVYTAIQYLSMALWGFPYMGVGRNLLYTRSLFFEGGQFDKHEHIASGDDDLFINSVATHSNTKINLHPSTFVFSHPKHTWRGYYLQKSRHLTTGTKYKLRHQLMLGMISLSHFLHYLGAIGLVLTIGYHEHIIFSYLVRIGLVIIVYALILRKFQEQNLLQWVPLFDFLYVFYYILFAPSLIGKKQKWK